MLRVIQSKWRMICVMMSRFFGVGLYGYEAWEINLESLFSYFALTFDQKCYYVQMKLVEEQYHWVKDDYKFCRCWSRLQSFLHTQYASNFLYASEVDCKGAQCWARKLINHRYREALERLVASQAIKIDTYSEPLVVVEPDVLEESESEVVSELVPL